MKTYNYFVVEIPTRIKDTVTTDGGLELYIDNRFKEFENRVNEGKVVAAPFKYDHGVEEGDTLYFHHHVVINDGQPLTGHEDHYVVLYSHGPETPMASQAFAFKNQQGEIKLLSGWCLLEEVDEPEVEQSTIVEAVSLEESPKLRGRVAFTSGEWMKDLGLEVGDIVGFQKNRDYRLKVDDKEYYRVRAEDLLYVEEEV